MYRDVLVATDGNDHTRGAIRHGLRIAGAYGATVHALYVVDTRYLSLDFEGGTDLTPVHDALEQAGRTATGELRDMGEELDVEVTTVLREGTPSREILEYAEDEGIDLIVVGAHGEGKLERLLLGSVTEKVIRQAPVPVLTARTSDATSESGYEEILVPTDGSKASEPAIEQGLSLAETFDAAVHALYVVDTRLSTSTLLLQALRNEGKQAISDFRRRGRETNLEIEASVVEGTPHEEILAYADGRSIDLISMGTHGRTGIDRFVTGSVAERVVRSASIPVMTTRYIQTDR